MKFGDDTTWRMFLREQMFLSIYEMKPGFHDDRELLDIYINYPTTCRWQNWTFKPGFFKTGGAA